MKTSIKIAIAALIIASFGFEGCKKGEGDPGLSLRSRKARMAGDWTVTSGEGNRTLIMASIAISETTVYDGSVETKTTNPGAIISTDKYTIAVTFDKDGSYTWIYTDINGSTPDVTTTKGTWNFTGGIGETKNKSQVLLTQESVANSSGTVTFSGSDAPTDLYDIYQLKNKEIILKSSYSSSINSENKTSSMTLTAK